MKAARRLLKAGFLLVVLVLQPALAPGAEPLPTRVSVALPGCKSLPFERTVVLELLSVELRSDGIERVAEGSTDAVAVLHIAQPDCDKAQVLLVVEDRATGKTVGRGVDLSAVDASSRARFLALSAVELLRASWLELLTLRPAAEDPLLKAVRGRVRAFLPPSEPPVPPASAAPLVSALPPAAPDPPAPPARRSSLRAEALGRGYLSSQGGLLGGLVGGQIPWEERLLLRLDARASRGEAFDPLGRVTLLQVSGAASLLAESRSGALRFALGPQIELGAGQVQGEPSSGQVRSSSGARAVGGIAAVGALSGAVSDHIELLGSIEAGTTFLGLTAQADGRHVAGMRGAFLGITLGLGWLR